MRETLLTGIGYLHEGLSSSDRFIVEQLFGTGAIQLVVVSRALTWSLTINSYLVVLLDTQEYDGLTHGYADYSVYDVLQMIGCANRPLLDQDGIAFILHSYAYDSLV